MAVLISFSRCSFDSFAFGMLFFLFQDCIFEAVCFFRIGISLFFLKGVQFVPFFASFHDRASELLVRVVPNCVP